MSKITSNILIRSLRKVIASSSELNRLLSMDDPKDKEWYMSKEADSLWLKECGNNKKLFLNQRSRMAWADDTAYSQPENFENIQKLKDGIWLVHFTSENKNLDSIFSNGFNGTSYEGMALTHDGSDTKRKGAYGFAYIVGDFRTFYDLGETEPFMLFKARESVSCEWEGTTQVVFITNTAYDMHRCYYNENKECYTLVDSTGKTTYSVDTDNVTPELVSEICSFCK